MKEGKERKRKERDRKDGWKVGWKEGRKIEERKRRTYL